jgi:PAS domain-containing protein
VSTLSDLVLAQGRSSQVDVDWLHMLVGDLQLLADLAFADIVLWVPSGDDDFVAVAHSRPSSAATLFYRDFVGQAIRIEWKDLVSQAFSGGRIVDSSAPDWYEEMPTRVRAVPVMRRLSVTGTELAPEPVAVITRHTNLGSTRTPSRQELTFNDCAGELFQMIASGDFPDLGAPTGPRRGAPRASDGLIRLDVDGTTTFASPNALSAFNRMGFDDELEGESLAEVTTRLLSGKLVVDESLPLVVTGRAPWRTDVESRGVTVSLRAIPIRHRGERIGAIVLSRDVTELRHQEQELITKDATIREIHHRVKNNLQTVASLLRIQARRTHSDEARDALTQAMRRCLRSCAAARRRGRLRPQHHRTPEAFGVVRRAAERIRDAAGARAHRARDERRRTRTRRSGGRRRDHGRPQLHRAHSAGARHRLGAARGQGGRGSRHADRAHPHPG